MKREGQIWIRIFPDKPYTKKPAEVRMGKGKGNPEEDEMVEWHHRLNGHEFE